MNLTDINFRGLVKKFSGDIFCTKQENGTKKFYGTRSSQAVTHPSTILARRCLTSVIRRERVYSSWYGRRHLVVQFTGICIETTAISNTCVTADYSDL